MARGRILVWLHFGHGYAAAGLQAIDFNLLTLPVIGHCVPFVLHPMLVVGGLVIGLVVVVLAG